MKGKEGAGGRAALFQTTTCQFTTICDSSSMGFNVLSWPYLAPGKHMVHIHRGKCRAEEIG